MFRRSRKHIDKPEGVYGPHQFETMRHVCHLHLSTRLRLHISSSTLKSIPSVSSRPPEVPSQPAYSAGESGPLLPWG